MVTWDEPRFVDNVGVVRVEEKSGHRPGQTLLWGTYQIAYVAFDQAGNTATCSFRVYILCKYFVSIQPRCYPNVVEMLMPVNNLLYHLSQLNSAQPFLILLAVLSSVKTGAQVASLKCVKSLVMLD